ncbi:Glycosyl transferase group 1, partial [Globisporangium splendens]
MHTTARTLRRSLCAQQCAVATSARGHAPLLLHERSLSTTSAATVLDSLIAYGERVLRTPEPLEKVALTLQCKEIWDAGELPVWKEGTTWSSDPPHQPSRSAKPPLFMPKELPSMKAMNTTIPIAMLHALAHIELGAIDNYWDTLVRFDPHTHNLPREFYHDFLTVASDEARHFKMVDDRLREIGSYYGELPATMALLEHATNTAADLAARIAVIPLVQEARGLDSGDRLVHKLMSMGDKPSARVVEQIVFEERSHVSCGMKWFQHICKNQPHVADPVTYFHELVLQFFPDGLPGPFDVQARLAADMEEKWYQPLENKARTYQPQPPAAGVSHGSSDSVQGDSSGLPSQSERVASFAASKKKVILTGSVWPERTSSAAGVRSSDLIEILQAHGFQVLCVSPSRVNEHTEKLAIEHNVQCVQADANTDTFQNLLLETSPQVVIFDRFIAEEMYGWQAKKYAPDAVRVLDLQDVHFVRKAREFLVKKQNVLFPETLDGYHLNVDPVEKQVIRELASIHRSDLTLYVSNFERDLLVNRFQIHGDALYCCDFFYPETDPSTFKGFAERKDIAFIGSFKHPPNVDAIEWMKQSILSEFRQQAKMANPSNVPEIHIYGSYGNTARYAKLADPAQGFRLMGFAPDVHDTLHQYRLTVAPLRFGAGIKGKVADSWHVGTPCVSTSIGAEGMEAQASQGSSAASQWGGIIADEPAAFARAMATLYADEPQWRAAQAAGAAICNARYNKRRNASALMQRLEHALVHKQSLRGDNWMGKILWSEKYRATEYMSRFIRAKNSLQ